MIVNEKHQGLRYGNSSYSDREIFSVFMVCVHGVHLKKKKTLLDESDVYQRVFRCAKLYTIKSSLHYRQTPTSVIISLITSSLLLLPPSKLLTSSFLWLTYSAFHL